MRNKNAINLPQEWISGHPGAIIPAGSVFSIIEEKDYGITLSINDITFVIYNSPNKIYESWGLYPGNFV